MGKLVLRKNFAQHDCLCMGPLRATGLRELCVDPTLAGTLYTRIHFGGAGGSNLSQDMALLSDVLPGLPEPLQADSWIVPSGNERFLPNPSQSVLPLDNIEQWFSNFFGSRRTAEHIKIFWRTSCAKLKIY
jgi:hypothetical protein